MVLTSIRAYKHAASRRDVLAGIQNNHKIVLISLRGVTGILFWGGKVIFPDFFPDVKCFFRVENSDFGRSKTNFRCFSILTPFPFFPCLFFPDTSAKISRSQVYGGALCPPPVTPLISLPTWDVQKKKNCRLGFMTWCQSAKTLSHKLKWEYLKYLS